MDLCEEERGSFELAGGKREREREEGGELRLRNEVKGGMLDEVGRAWVDAMVEEERMVG